MAFHINVQPSGREFEVLEGETILEAGIRQSINLPYGCKDGACGSCKCKAVSGSVAHKPYQDKAMSEQELADGYILTCRATPQSDLVLESRQVTHADAFPARKMPCRVTQLNKLSHDVMEVTLQLPAKAPFQFHAGQYIDFILADGQRRSYSIATAPFTLNPDTPSVQLHIRHLPGGKFTDHVFGSMKEKEILRMEGPFGSFYIHDTSTGPIVFLASGTGFAPIKAMLEQMAETGLTRPISLYWGANRPADLYMHQWMQDFAAKHPQVSYIPVISNAQPEDTWDGLRGLALDVMLQQHPNMADYQLYACGAPAMVHAAQEKAIGQNQLPSDAFFADAFTSLKDKANTPA